MGLFFALWLSFATPPDILTVEQFAKQVRASDLPDLVKGTQLLTLVEAGMTTSQVKRIFGDARPGILYHGFLTPACQFHYCRYGAIIHFNFEGQVAAKQNNQGFK